MKKTEIDKTIKCIEKQKKTIFTFGIEITWLKKIVGPIIMLYKM